jgi:lipoprotein-anchoring transpeptidase ErfK/SrfK
MSTKGRVAAYIAGVAVIAVAAGLLAYWLRPHGEAAPKPSAGEAAAATGGKVAPKGDGGAGQVPGPEGQKPPVDAGAGEAAADEGLALESSGRLYQAQLRLSEALKAGIEGPKGAAVREKLISLANRIQWSPQHQAEDPYSKVYEVKSGDALINIGSQCFMPYEFIMKLNGLTTPDIKIGQSLKLVQGPVHVEIFKSKHELQAWLDKVCIRVYAVGLGTDNKTPENTFSVVSKIRNPKYEPTAKPKSAFKESGAPDNPLGTRWIDIGNHFGIHGTIDDSSIGKDKSEGCIRMHNKEVEELYDLVVLKATTVTIHP